MQNGQNEENHSNQFNNPSSQMKQTNTYYKKEYASTQFPNSEIYVRDDNPLKTDGRYVNRRRQIHRYNPMEKKVPFNEQRNIINKSQHHIQATVSPKLMNHTQVPKYNANWNHHPHKNYSYNQYNQHKKGEYKNKTIWNHTQEDINNSIIKNKVISQNNTREPNNENKELSYPLGVVPPSTTNYFTGTTHEIYQQKIDQREPNYYSGNTNAQGSHLYNYYAKKQKTMCTPTNAYGSYIPKLYHTNKTFTRNTILQSTPMNTHQPTHLKNAKWNRTSNLCVGEEGTQRNNNIKKKKNKRKKKKTQNHYNKAENTPTETKNAHHQEQKKKHFCEYCDEYVDEHKKEEHDKEEHAKCPMEGCNGIYKKENLEFHLLSHMKNKNNETILNNPKEIQKWIEERKKNYPTKNKIANEKTNNKNGMSKRRNKPNCLIEELIFENYCSAIGKNMIQKQNLQKSVFIPLLNRLAYNSYDNVYENEYYNLYGTQNKNKKTKNELKKNLKDKDGMMIDTLHIHKSPPLLYQIMKEEIYSYEQKLMKAIEYITSCNFFDEKEEELVVAIDDNDEKKNTGKKEELQNM